jgi:hypothetical protein
MMNEETARHSEPFAKPRSSAREYHPVLREILSQKERESREFVSQQDRRIAYDQEHVFKVSAYACSDGRVSDLVYVLGLLPGLLESFRDPGSKETSLREHTLMQRMVGFNRDVRYGESSNVQGRSMGQIHLSLAHYSRGRDDNGCGAWKNDTEGYVRHMRSLAAELNAWDKSRIIAVTGLLDTNEDSIRLYGQHHEEIWTGDYTSETNDSNERQLCVVRERIIKRLEEIFPRSSEPVLSFFSAYRDAFYVELAGLLTSNVEFIEQVRRNVRPIEHLDHQEEMIFLGRPLETKDHNAAFLIEDRGDYLAHLKLGMKYVVRNIVTAAVKNAERADPAQWVVPIFISIPHDGDNAYPVSIYAKHIREQIEASLPEIASWLAMNVAVPDDLPADVQKTISHLATEIPKRVRICATIHDRNTRKPVPVDDPNDIR